MSRIKALVAPVVALALMAGAPAAIARDGDVRAAGSCTGKSTSKIKLALRDGGIQAEFEVDQNVNGKAWNWTLRQNDVQVASGSATTVAPSGSFTVRRSLPNRAGTDGVVGQATNPATGEVCTASASI